MNRIILKSKDGYILTNGQDFGKIIYLSVNSDPKEYYEITKDEYKRIVEEQQQKEKIMRGEQLWD